VHVHDDRELRAAETIASWMDRRFVDPILGFLVPGAGDVLGALVGLYPVMLAWRRRAPKVLVARMLLNLSVDLLVGLVPLLGDVWDFFFRAHSRNLALLRARHQGAAVRANPRDWLVVVGAGLLFLVALVAPIVLLVVASRALRRGG
jgi:hypothetical protein